MVCVLNKYYVLIFEEKYGSYVLPTILKYGSYVLSWVVVKEESLPASVFRVSKGLFERNLTETL